MKALNLDLEVETSDTAEAASNCEAVAVAGLCMFFPDRTPRARLQAIADAINAALDAAREVEGLNRD